MSQVSLAPTLTFQKLKRLYKAGFYSNFIDKQRNAGDQLPIVTQLLRDSENR